MCIPRCGGRSRCSSRSVFNGREETPMETKNREKLLLMATGTVAVLWLLNLLVFSPLNDSWHSRSGEIAKLKKEIADGVMMVRRESTIRDRWDTMRGNALASNPTVAERQV